ncbi:type 1 glutamine amidotransferase domain-containing protein [Streptomyces sp. NBC_00510]
MRHVLLVLTSHTELGGTGRLTGFHVADAAHPWRIFTAAGFGVNLVSPQGGRPYPDCTDVTDPVQMKFLNDASITQQLANAMTPDDVIPGNYDAILYAGGYGGMWDFPQNPVLMDVARRIYEAGGVVGAVGHGVAGLVNTALSDGSYLVAGRQVAAFSNEEELSIGLGNVIPFLLQSRLEERGARYSAAPEFRPHVVVDGRLVTGQNPASAAGVGQAIVSVLCGLTQSADHDWW